MFEAMAMQQTPVIAQPYVETFRQRPKTPDPVIERRVPSAGETGPSVIRIRTLDTSVIGTATVADLMRRIRLDRSVDVPTTTNHNIVDKARNDRVHLLARKYADKLDVEANARLEIVTERLNRLSPRITPSTLDRVAKMVSKIDDADVDLADLRSRYNF